MSVQDLAAHVLRRAESRPPGTRYVLGIAGPPGAGKSHLATALRDAITSLAGDAVAEIAPMDGFHLPNATLIRQGKLAGKGEPDTFDAAHFVELLDKVMIAENVVFWPTFDRDTDEPTPAGAVFTSATTIVITEGNYLLLDDGDWAAVRPLLNESWYLDEEHTLLEQRLLARHQGGGKSPDEAQHKVNSSDLRNAELIVHTKVHADAVIHQRDGEYLFADTADD